MAIANLAETIRTSIYRKAALQQRELELRAQKRILTLEQNDEQMLLNAQKAEIDDYYEDQYEQNEDLQVEYSSFRELPDYEDEIKKITAKTDDNIERLVNQELVIDSQIASISAESIYWGNIGDSARSLIKEVISGDFSYGITG